MGSLPTGYLVAKSKGIDIKTVGSGNIGATNVTRAMGKSWGIFVLIVDALKGFIPVFFVKMYFTNISLTQLYLLMTIAGICTVLGHVFTPFLKFKGGKGIATSLGMIAAIKPSLALILLAVWVGAFFITRVSSVGALSAAVSLPFAAWFLFRSTPMLGIMVAFAIFMFVFIIYTHRKNIENLYKGEEKALKKK